MNDTSSLSTLIRPVGHLLPTLGEGGILANHQPKVERSSPNIGRRTFCESPGQNLKILLPLMGEGARQGG